MFSVVGAASAAPGLIAPAVGMRIAGPKRSPRPGAGATALGTISSKSRCPEHFHEGDENEEHCDHRSRRAHWLIGCCVCPDETRRFGNGPRNPNEQHN